MMRNPLKLEKYSIGMGDRFAQQAEPQLRACLQAAEHGLEIIPVWNKSNREHLIVGSEPSSVAGAAAEAVRKLAWKQPWHVDADHIRIELVDRFIPCSDFFTIDVAESIGKPASNDAINAFVNRHPELSGRLDVPGIESPLEVSRAEVRRVAGKYLFAAGDAARIHRYIAGSKGQGGFITEVSMDETDSPQTPLELLIILAALADEGVPLQTIAPKFTGRFNKGVDYAGDIERFEKEFNDDLAVIRLAVATYGLPDNLKLSIHSGSDKFSIYPAIGRGLRRHNAGLHIKTAGTTWLEELIGLAEAGGDGLKMATGIYAGAFEHLAELCAPYAAVIDIDRSRLPDPAAVSKWTSGQFAAALRHDPGCREFNPHLRQLLHVGYKVAAKKRDEYLCLIQQCNGGIARNVTFNIFERHLKPIFLGAD